MDFTLLKEFLNSNMTQKDFSKLKNVSATWISHKLSREIRWLLNTKVIDGKSIICDTSTMLNDIRRNKENWLKAISAYEQTVASPIIFTKDNRKIGDLSVSEFANLLRALNES